MKYRHNQPYQPQYIRLVVWSIIITLDAILVYSLVTNNHTVWKDLYMW